MPIKLTMLKIVWRLIEDFPPNKRASNIALKATVTERAAKFMTKGVMCTKYFVSVGESILIAKILFIINLSFLSSERLS